MAKTLTVDEIISKAEQEVRKSSSSKQVKQSFTGALRVQPSEVFVSKRDGERALHYLKQSKFKFRSE